MSTEIRTVPTSYRVTAWPEELSDCLDAETWCITVADRGHGLWAVVRGGADGRSAVILDDRHGWGFEQIPSERSDDWRAHHRFPLERALELATEMAPKVTMNGMTALEVIEHHRQRRD